MKNARVASITTRVSFWFVGFGVPPNFSPKFAVTPEMTALLGPADLSALLLP